MSRFTKNTVLPHRLKADLVLEEGVVEVSFEAAGEGDGGGRPAHGEGEVQLAARLNLLGVLGGEVHLDDLHMEAICLLSCQRKSCKSYLHPKRLSLSIPLLKAKKTAVAHATRW